MNSRSMATRVEKLESALTPSEALLIVYLADGETEQQASVRVGRTTAQLVFFSTTDAQVM